MRRARSSTLGPKPRFRRRQRLHDLHYILSIWTSGFDDSIRNIRIKCPAISNQLHQTRYIAPTSRISISSILIPKSKQPSKQSPFALHRLPRAAYSTTFALFKGTSCAWILHIEARPMASEEATASPLAQCSCRRDCGLE